MKLDDYKQISDVKKELICQNRHIIEIFKLFILVSNLSKISFLKYDAKYKCFNYKYTLDNENILENDISLIKAKNSKILQIGDIIYGKIAFDEDLEENDITNEFLERITLALKKSSDIENRMLSEDMPINIFIISDEKTKDFSLKFKENLNLILNAEIKIVSSINDIKENLQINSTKSHIIYCVKNDELIKSDEEYLNYFNEFTMVIGPNNHSISLICGKLNIQKYLSIDEYSPQKVKDILIENKNVILNKDKQHHKIISISGISGGVGTTTVAMNISDMIASNNIQSNVLFIDLSTTKAVSNIFLAKNPLPEKTIIDLVNIDEFSINKYLDNGLVKISENFYSVNGIQKHIDKDLIEQEIFIEKLLNFLLKATEFFNYIIIDTGEADASTLKSTIYDVVDDIWVITQMNLPHISKLKTFYSLIKRAGLKEKLLFMVNRFDSQNALSVSDVESILNTSKDDDLNFELKIPNDYENLGKCWNYCELATKTAKDSIFVEKIEEILIKQNLISEKKIIPKPKSIFSFLKKDKK